MLEVELGSLMRVRRSKKTKRMRWCGFLISSLGIVAIVVLSARYVVGLWS